MLVSLRGARIHVEEVGAGPPVLFLHGVPDSSRVWKGLMARLAPRRRCLAPDMPGFGLSGVPEGFDWKLPSTVPLLSELVEALGVREPLVLVVHDISGLCLAWAAENPAKIGGVVAFNTTFSTDYRWHSVARVWRTPFLGELSFKLAGPWLFDKLARRGSPGLPADYTRETLALLTPETRRTILRMYRGFEPADFGPWETRVRELFQAVPSVVVWGDRDPYIPARFAESFGAREVRHFPGLGHWTFLEDEDGAFRALSGVLG